MDMETGYCKMCDEHAATIESLRQQLAECERERDSWKTEALDHCDKVAQQAQELANAYKTVDENWVTHQKMGALQEQLATVTKQRFALERAILQHQADVRYATQGAALSLADDALYKALKVGAGETAEVKS